MICFLFFDVNTIHYLFWLLPLYCPVYAFFTFGFGVLTFNLNSLLELKHLNYSFLAFKYINGHFSNLLSILVPYVNIVFKMASHLSETSCYYVSFSVSFGLLGPYSWNSLLSKQSLSHKQNRNRMYFFNSQKEKLY